jgi:tRNA threonylcarbamoyladenosine biosynthesis protein TsaB
VYYFGDGAAKCQSVLKKPNWHFVPDVVPESRHLAVIIGPMSVQYRKITTDLAYYEPYYLKEFVAAPSHVKGLKS